jgi:hypothetical protein
VQNWWKFVLEEFTYDYRNSNGPVHNKFEDEGYNSRFMKNMGAFIFMLVVYLFALYWLFKGFWFMKKKTKFKKFMLKFQVYMKLSFVWRLIIITYFQIAIMVMYQLSVMLDDDLSASIILAFIFLIYVLGMPILFQKMINTPYDKKQKGYLPACKYVGLYQDYKINKVETKTVVPKDLIRRLLMAVVLSFCYDWPYVQIILCIVLVYKHLGYLKKFKPFKHDVENKRCVYNEYTVVLLYLVCLFYMIDEQSFDMIEATTMKTIGFVVITIYTLIQIFNIYLIIQGARKGSKMRSLANLVDGKQQPDLLQFKLKRKDTVRRKQTKFEKAIKDWDDLRPKEERSDFGEDESLVPKDKQNKRRNPRVAPLPPLEKSKEL